MGIQMMSIPISNRRLNLHELLSNEKWYEYKQKCLKESNNECVICKSKEDIHCHEHWSFDVNECEVWSFDVNECEVTGEHNKIIRKKYDGIQKLENIIAVCNKCHQAIHFVTSSHFMKDKELEDVVKHYMKVNKVTLKIFLKHMTNAIQRRYRYDELMDWEVVCKDKTGNGLTNIMAFTLK